jgi:hypothetical protein
MQGVRKRNYCNCANLVCLNQGVHPSQVCRKCAVRSELICANLAFFDTLQKRFRAGLGNGKLLILNMAALKI